MSMSYYAVEGYGFCEREMNLETVKTFIKEHATEQVRKDLKSMEGYDIQSLDDLADVCCEIWGEMTPSCILAATIAEKTGQLVEVCCDENEGFKVLLLPSYPWHDVTPMSQEEFDRIAQDLADKFYDPCSASMNYESCIRVG